MSPPRHTTCLRRVIRIVVAVLLLLGAGPVAALDYERNDVRSREIGLVTMISPTDVDLRAPGRCAAGSTAQCDFVKLPFGIGVRAAARRHVRFLYVGTEVLAGFTLPSELFPAHPVLGVGGMAGMETATDGFRRLRGYGEIGVDLVWTQTRIFDIVHFFAEAGLRYQVQQYDRPHVFFGLGLRGLYNLQHAGTQLHVDMGWTFD